MLKDRLIVSIILQPNLNISDQSGDTKIIVIFCANYAIFRFQYKCNTRRSYEIFKAHDYVNEFVVLAFEPEMA
jgi:hypothetical protein